MMTRAAHTASTAGAQEAATSSPPRTGPSAKTLDSAAVSRLNAH